jgi:glycosylphosphatidylinositol transamidase (GPIT) subunit GPI8
LGHDRYIGVATIDRWTHAVLSVAEGMGPDSNMTLAALLGAATPRRVGSTPALRDDLLDRPADQVRATDFFGSVFKVEDIGNEPFDFAGIAWP